MKDPGYRHEYKYLVSQKALEILKVRLMAVMRPDPHAGKEGSYLIRSVYFDDMYDSCYHENEDGVQPREKYRIRVYNRDSSFISLERKRKEFSKTLKISERIDESECREILEKGRVIKEPGEGRHLLKLIRALNMTSRLSPRIIVEYVRTPFICTLGNVRITFDRNIAASDKIDRFFERDISAIPVLPAGTHLLEVKFDAFLPDYIRMAIENENLRAVTFSKYYLCRERQGVI